MHFWTSTSGCEWFKQWEYHHRNPEYPTPYVPFQAKIDHNKWAGWPNGWSYKKLHGSSQHYGSSLYSIHQRTITQPGEHSAMLLLSRVKLVLKAAVRGPHLCKTNKKHSDRDSVIPLQRDSHHLRTERVKLVCRIWRNGSWQVRNKSSARDEKMNKEYPHFVSHSPVWSGTCQSGTFPDQSIHERNSSSSSLFVESMNCTSLN